MRSVVSARIPPVPAVDIIVEADVVGPHVRPAGSSSRRAARGPRRSRSTDADGAGRILCPASILRDELHGLIDQLPEAQVAPILAIVRESAPTEARDGRARSGHG